MAEIILENRHNYNTVLESINVTPSFQSVGVEEITDATDASQYLNYSQASLIDEEPKLPILNKSDDRSKKIQTFLKKEHTTLSNEVKDITTNQYPGFEVLLSTLQHHSEEHELLKKYIEESELLKKKYSEEYAEKKRLYNEVIELKGNIRVFCRCRPLNQEEITNGSSSVVEIAPSQDQELSITCADSSKKQFKFDHVFGPHAELEVFTQTAIVTSVLDGYNVCIFSYGQTGTGKTFTLEGTPENRGVNYRTLEELFRIANHRTGAMRYELFVSMLEVYNEKIRDLLVENNSEPPKKLEILQTPEGTQEIPGLVEAHVYRTEEVWELLKIGSRVRSVGSTNANEFSNRSHCLLQVTVRGENLLTGQRTKSNLWLVDLAGSERVGRIEVEGDKLKESLFINKSLSALGDVISSLATKTAIVPYSEIKMVARTVPTQRKIMRAPPLSPTLLRETVKKVDQCMARLQELQYTVTGGNKVVNGVKLSPRSTKSYLKTSLRCKQESMRIRKYASKKSPNGKFPTSVTGEWKRMSLSAMLVGETVAEILQASKMAKEIMRNYKIEDPKTPLTRKQRPNTEKTPIETRRKREKQHQFRIIRAESSTPAARRARSKINFKISPEKRPKIEGGNNGNSSSMRYTTNRVSPKHKPWAKKTVLFPNPLFHSSPNSKHQQFCKTKSPLIAAKKRETPHKFLVKSPVKIKSPHKGFAYVSPISKPVTLRRKSPPPIPSSSSMASKLRRSLSPSRLANRFVSPLKGRRMSMNGSSCDALIMNGVKQKPPALMMMPPMRFSGPKNVGNGN